MTNINEDWLAVARQREDIARRIDESTSEMSRERLIYILLSYMTVADAEHVARAISG